MDGFVGADPSSMNGLDMKQRLRASDRPCMRLESFATGKFASPLLSPREQPLALKVGQKRRLKSNRITEVFEQ
jgi:hypothetical protein